MTRSLESPFDTSALYPRRSLAWEIAHLPLTIVGLVVLGVVVLVFDVLGRLGRGR